MSLSTPIFFLNHGRDIRIIIIMVGTKYLLAIQFWLSIEIYDSPVGV